MKIDKEYILAFLKENKEFLRERYGVEKISLFGSFARGEETEESDIDLFVEIFDVDYHKLSGVYIFLEESFHRKISLVHKHAGLKEKFLRIISEDLILVA
ncbi:MAG: nucleotidyltransferase domain-containing protein [bacterium]